MEDKEKLIVYSNASSVFAYSAEIRPDFKISVSQGQGFAWNQDLFATQYQQSYKVVYDAHEDDFDQLIRKIKGKLRATAKKRGKMKVKAKFTRTTKPRREAPVHAAEGSDEDGDSDRYQRIQVLEGHEFPRGNTYKPVWAHDLHSDENDSAIEGGDNQDIDMTGDTPYPRMAVVDRPRRKSERSISFVEDSKTGDYRYHIGQVDVVEVDSDTPENNHLKSLII
ncbi:Ugx2p [Saccharomyces cerevisiae x Saccharomyces kudriavzevii VIN7]|uniref:Ugx2p n=1 Tax=Saccharomyces cerevisiae x Saccharomyces kudriavzevii (strain VIN7) TaxID=1095631 RepID=H0GS77_SACCK|nr:Ugx2p [Saccharomyces cerevisiae x Saccharomyces kudriavzevii VIN7]